MTYFDRWSWTQFAFGFAITGVVAFLHVVSPFDAFWPHLLETCILAAAGGSLTGRFGDGAWRAIVNFLSWF